MEELVLVLPETCLEKAVLTFKQEFFDQDEPVILVVVCWIR
ncbi:hypothetical protein [Enterococcus sp. AZ109]